MAIPYSAGTAFTTPTCVRAWYEYPFRDQGDSVTKLYHNIMQVQETSYAPLADDDVLTDAGQKPERSPFADDAAAYYVGDSSLNHIGDGLVEFDRMFANIPADRIETNGFYSFEYPIRAALIENVTTTSESSSYNTGTLELTITATLSAPDAAKFNDGDNITITNASGWNYTAGTTTYTRTSFTGKCTKSGSTLTLVVSLFYFLSGVPTAFTGFTDNAPASYLVSKVISPGRSSTAQLNSASILSYRYVKTSNPESLSLVPRFLLTTSAGLVTTALSTTTIPITTDEYNEASQLGTYVIAAESEVPIRWYGNIYEISQILVQAL